MLITGNKLATVLLVEVRIQLGTAEWADQRWSFPFAVLGLGALEVTGEAVVTNGKFKVTALRLSEPSDGLTSDSLRTVPMGEVILGLLDGINQLPPDAVTRKTALALIDDSRAIREGIYSYDEVEADQALVQALRWSIRDFQPNRGRGARSDDWYREVAVLYLQALESDPRRPIQSMTETLRRKRKDPGLSRETVSTWVRRAREEEWLTRSTRGKAGGLPGRNLRVWLKSQEMKEKQ